MKPLPSPPLPLICASEKGARSPTWCPPGRAHQPLLTRHFFFQTPAVSVWVVEGVAILGSLHPHRTEQRASEDINARPSSLQNEVTVEPGGPDLSAIRDSCGPAPSKCRLGSGRLTGAQKAGSKRLPWEGALCSLQFRRQTCSPEGAGGRLRP